MWVFGCCDPLLFLEWLKKKPQKTMKTDLRQVCGTCWCAAQAASSCASAAVASGMLLSVQVARAKRKKTVAVREETSEGLGQKSGARLVCCKGQADKSGLV